MAKDWKWKRRVQRELTERGRALQVEVEAAVEAKVDEMGVGIALDFEEVAPDGRAKWLREHPPVSPG